MCNLSRTFLVCFRLCFFFRPRPKSSNSILLQHSLLAEKYNSMFPSKVLFGLSFYIFICFLFCIASHIMLLLPMLVAQIIVSFSFYYLFILFLQWKKNVSLPRLVLLQCNRLKRMKAALQSNKPRGLRYLTLTVFPCKQVCMDRFKPSLPK